jgi:LysM repeat protein
MILRRPISLFLLLILATALPVMAKEEQTYTIKQGDTLWGISQRFIDDPYYWPNIWANNPDVTNPHLIFPGQKIHIKDGRLKIIPAYPEAEQLAPVPQVETAGTAAVSQPETQIQIKSTGSGDGFILTDEQPLGLLVDSVDNRILLSKNDLVFLKMQDSSSVTVGDTYGLFNRGELVRHPQTLKPVGTMMHNLGFLQITEVNGDSITAKIGAAYREITRGAELFEYVPPRAEMTLQRGAADLAGYIIATRDGKSSLGTPDVVFIDLGSDDGLLSGNLFYISRPRSASDEIIKQAGEVSLPDAVLGAAVVIEAKRNSASAIIIKSVDAMIIGDQVTVVNN